MSMVTFAAALQLDPEVSIGWQLPCRIGMPSRARRSRKRQSLLRSAPGRFLAGGDLAERSGVGIDGFRDGLAIDELPLAATLD